MVLWRDRRVVGRRIGTDLHGCDDQETESNPIKRKWTVVIRSNEGITGIVLGSGERVYVVSLFAVNGATILSWVQDCDATALSSF